MHMNWSDLFFPLSSMQQEEHFLETLIGQWSFKNSFVLGAHLKVYHWVVIPRPIRLFGWAEHAARKRKSK